MRLRSASIVSASQSAVVLWSDASVDKWDEQVSVPNYLQLSLLSAAALGYDTWLWSYHPEVQNIPSTCNVLDAGALWSREDAKALAMRPDSHIAFVADYVRLLACRRHTSRSPPSISCSLIGVKTQEGAWFVDLDNIWLQVQRRVPTSSGDLYATMSADLNQFFGITPRTFLLQGVRYPGERLWMSTPIFFAQNSAVLQRVIGALRRKLSLPIRSYISFFMAELQKAIHEEGQVCDMVDPGVFNPLPYNKTCQYNQFKASRSSDEVSTSVETATAVSQYWCSSKPSWASAKVSARRGLTLTLPKIEQGSLYAKILSLVGVEVSNETVYLCPKCLRHTARLSATSVLASFGEHECTVLTLALSQNR